MATANTDTASLRLIIQLQREDLDQLSNSRKRKHPEGDIPDADLAIEASKNELQKLEKLLTDRAMGESIARAVGIDGKTITSKMVADDQVAQDRKIARTLEANPQKSIPKTPARITPLNDELLSKLEILYGCSDEGPRKKPTGEARKQRQCVSCQDKFDFADVARCPCSHEYCRECLSALFQACTTDESLFPPRCCKKPIPIEANRIFLPSKLVGEFMAKKVEFETPNRTYCHDPKCSTFIPIQFIQRNVAHCVRCTKKTCCLCKGVSHIGNCPPDPETIALLRVARENGWQRCTECGRMVELGHGCYHMTCPCKHHFCYVCGQKWKTCKCPIWDENRLLNAANQAVQRNPANAQLQGQAREAEVARMRQYIELNHDCEDHEWKRFPGADDCEECGKWFPHFIYQCQDCLTLACSKCRYNRL